MQKQEYFISVGEPWDFNSPDGQNIINGIIVKILSPSCLVFKANYMLDLKGITGDYFILYPRHSESDFDDLRTGENYVTVNGNLLTEEFDENMSEDYLKEHSKFVIIGSIQTQL